MRRHLVPYLAFLASLVFFGWALRGANDGVAALVSVVLALMVWNVVANRSKA